jgi:hypothetical protein
VRLQKECGLRRNASNDLDINRIGEYRLSWPLEPCSAVDGSKEVARFEVSRALKSPVVESLAANMHNSKFRIT